MSDQKYVVTIFFTNDRIYTSKPLNYNRMEDMIAKLNEGKVFRFTERSSCYAQLVFPQNITHINVNDADDPDL